MPGSAGDAADKIWARGATPCEPETAGGWTHYPGTAPRHDAATKLAPPNVDLSRPRGRGPATSDQRGAHWLSPSPACVEKMQNSSSSAVRASSSAQPNMVSR